MGHFDLRQEEARGLRHHAYQRAMEQGKPDFIAEKIVYGAIWQVNTVFENFEPVKHTLDIVLDFLCLLPNDFVLSKTDVEDFPIAPRELF